MAISTTSTPNDVTSSDNIKNNTLINEDVEGNVRSLLNRSHKIKKSVTFNKNKKHKVNPFLVYENDKINGGRIKKIR